MGNTSPSLNRADSSINLLDEWSTDYYDEPAQLQHTKKRRFDAIDEKVLKWCKKSDNKFKTDEVDRYRELILRDRPALNTSPLEWYRQSTNIFYKAFVEVEEK